MSGSVIMRDTGFGADDFDGAFVAVDGPVPTDAAAIDLACDADIAAVSGDLRQVRMVRIDFPNAADGRGFTLAKRLRALGYRGRLRAKGHVLADQYAMARRSGFDEVEIAPDLAQRQPEADWLARADWRQNDYQARLRG